MKLKKYIGVMFGACALVLLAGCYEPLEITDKEMDMVAEYAAGVLVKHGTQATDVLLDREEQEEAWAALATPTPRPTLAPVKDKDDQKPSVDDKDDDKEKPAATAKPTPTSVPDNTEMTMQDLTELMNKDGFFFRYTGYETATLYQGTGDMFAAAGEGKQLVVLMFDVTNQSGSGASLVLNMGVPKEFVYTLRIGNRAIRPSLTVLEEDFYTSYDVSYKAGETKKCVLVFECDEDIIKNSMNLAVLRNVEGNEDSVLLKVK